jgi:diguanylate cyclase
MIGFTGSAFTVFISILYPVGDIVLLAMVLVYVLLTPILVFALCFLLEAYYLLLSQIYSLFGHHLIQPMNLDPATDDGWIAGSAATFYISFILIT